MLISFFITLLCFSLQMKEATAVTSTINSIAAGNWSTGSNWSTGVVPDADDFVNINNPMNLNANLSPAAGATYTFYAASSGTGGLNMATGAVLDIRANVTLTGSGVNLNGGTIYVRSGYTLTLNDIATANSSTFIIVEAGATLRILNNFLDNHGTMTIDGTLTVDGNYDGQAADATVTGSGDFTTGGYMKGINGSSIFGVVNPNCPGPNCNARNLCASYTVSVSPTSSTICSPTTQTLTSTVSSASTYQWQIATVSGGTFTDIGSATNATYTAGFNGGVKAYYRVKATGTCIRYSNEAVVIPGSGGGPGSLTLAPSSPTYCQNSVQTFTATVTGASQYVWTVPSGYTILSGVGTSSISVRIGSASGNVTVTPSNGCGTGATVSTTVTVTPLPANPGAISGPTDVCQNAAGIVYSIATVSGASGYTWILPSGAYITAGASTISVTVTFSTNAGNVSVTPVNTCGYSSSASSTLPVTISTVAPSAVGTITGATTVCKEQTAVPYSIAAVTGAKSYSATLPTGATIASGTGTISITASFAGASVSSGSLIFTATNGCGSTNNNKTITINSGCAESWTGGTSTNWNTASNWSLGYVPVSTTPVTISSGTTFAPSVTTTITVASVTINSGATLTISSTGTLNTTGNIVNNSGGTLATVSGSTLAFTGGSAQTITGVPTLYNVVVNNTSGGVSLLSALTLNGTLTLTKGVLTTGSNLTLNFDNGGNIAYNSGETGSISGTVSGYRMAGVKTHYIAAPFSGVTSAQVQATTPLYVNPYWKMYSKNFTAQNWTAVVNTTTAMPLGTGFSLSFPVAAPLILTGTYDHTFTLTGPTYSNTTVDKYFMVGNPYPSTLDWNAASGWTKTNVGGAIYYWDGINNRTASYVFNVGTNGGTQYIPAMQSVLVATTGTGGSSSVSINNNARLSSQNPSYLRVGAPDDIIRITLIGSDTTYNDETVIRFNETATDNFDYDLDAHKILNTGFMPSVYTNSGTDIYSINSFEPIDTAKYIPLGAKLSTDGAYSLKIEGANPNVEYVLVDKLLGTQQNIDMKGSYVFNGSTTDDVNRFELQLRTSATTVTTGIQSSNKSSGLSILSSAKGFVLKTDRYAGEDVTIEIFDIAGNSVKVLSGKNLSTGSTFVPLDLAEGSYIVKVQMDSNTFAGLIVLLK